MDKIENHPAWKGAIRREQAEELLKNKPSGTYLFRQEDEITQTIEEALKEETHLPLHCYVLTLMEEDNKILEFLFIRMKDKWMIYDDDPDISHLKKYDSLHKALDSLQKAKFPLQTRK